MAVSLALALVLGMTTYLCWLFVGREAYQGGIPQAIADRGLLIYGVLALAWAVVGAVTARWRHVRWSVTSIALAATLAWLIQGGIVIIFGSLIADELRSIPFNASIWLVATGVVLQPIAVFVGSALGARLGRPTPRDLSSRSR
jgi:hypothetical protein